MSGSRLYVVAYDIACPKRWRRVFKVMKRHGARPQLSVWLARLSPVACARMEAALRRHLKEGDDKLLIADLGPAATAAAKLVPGITIG